MHTTKIITKNYKQELLLLEWIMESTIKKQQRTNSAVLAYGITKYYLTWYVKIHTKHHMVPYDTVEYHTILYGIIPHNTVLQQKSGFSKLTNHKMSKVWC